MTEPNTPGLGEWHPMQTCAWCGQTGDCIREGDEHGEWWTCHGCWTRDEPPEPEPEPMRLFEPAPATMRGETSLPGL